MTTEGHIAALERRHREIERQIEDEMAALQPGEIRRGRPRDGPVHRRPAEQVVLGALLLHHARDLVAQGRRSRRLARPR